jgi:HPt (histidine-containing phosphotransfer) domain-containing protein
VAATFDEVELLARVDNDLGFLAETVDMLVADAPSLLEQARSAMLRGDGAGVGRHAHALKGMISNFCAPAAQDAALTLEKLGKAGDLAGAPPALESLRERIDALTRELVAYVRTKE